MNTDYSELKKLLLAAQGYNELGMIPEALAEIDCIPQSARNWTQFRQLRLALHLQAKQWAFGLADALWLCRAEPTFPLNYIHAAFCLHEMGQTSVAKALLLGGPMSLRGEATYHYNLGCYEAKLGNLESAQEYIETSFRLDKKFRSIASKDPALAVLRLNIAIPAPNYEGCY